VVVCIPLVWCKFAGLGLKNCENNFKFPLPQNFQTKTKSFQDNQNQVINPSINNGSQQPQQTCFRHSQAWFQTPYTLFLVSTAKEGVLGLGRKIC
jgi:hypothetical protein